MEPKKSPKADLESKRNIFVQIGLVVSLGLCLLAFEWTSRVEQASSLGSVAEQEVEDEIIPITRQEEVKPPPPPPPPKVVEVLNIVEDDVEIEDELEIQDTEADDETVIDVAPVIQEEEEVDEGQVFFIVEDMPEFPGGELALRKFIANAVKYPVIAQENGIQGKVYVNFVVDKDGSITNARIARGVDASLDKEALRVVNSLPKWKPGKQRGKPVRVSYTVPINFVLQ
ncbi:energy transducer TonB [Sunxiuqinia indica]|uniref:energy transducer TonB n=1 Tax=Sunxiuqinia indica TaxID=2692584 RepID=UPI00135BFBB0|nr:energy transducer TonB [Sunxiuqinia indica]